MSRVIKFRAKNLKGEWCYGYFCKDFSGTAYITTLDGVDTYTVDENTLCQFTEFHDKNGKEIYEWDKDKVGNVVEYLNGCYCLNGDRPLSWMGLTFEVEGNIYDNA